MRISTRGVTRSSRRERVRHVFTARSVHSRCQPKSPPRRSLSAAAAERNVHATFHPDRLLYQSLYTPHETESRPRESVRVVFFNDHCKRSVAPKRPKRRLLELARKTPCIRYTSLLKKRRGGGLIYPEREREKLAAALGAAAAAAHQWNFRPVARASVRERDLPNGCEFFTFLTRLFPFFFNNNNDAKIRDSFFFYVISRECAWDDCDHGGIGAVVRLKKRVTEQQPQVCVCVYVCD